MLLAPDRSVDTLSVAGQELQLFVEPEPAFEAMLADIRQAKRRVWLETYIFASDAVGLAVAEALKERARAGLDVRLIYDAVGSFSTYPSFFLKMVPAGVKVVCYHSLGEVLQRLAALRILNRRDHRKVLVIDDDVAYFGGMNIVATVHGQPADASAAMASSRGWHDLHVRMRGSQQREVAVSFERSWQHALGRTIPVRPHHYRKGLLSKERERIHFFDSGPGRRFSRSARIFTHLLNMARHEITFSMAYFLPVGRAWHALLRAARRGVKIRVIVPGQSDVPLLQRASTYLYQRLLSSGVQIFERQGVMLHGKVMLVDGEWTVLGSSNFDALSLWVNLEFLAVIHSEEMARHMGSIVDREMQRSRPVTAADLKAYSRWQRLINRLAWSLRWWL
jgi:cardiolipin synthase